MLLALAGLRILRDKRLPRIICFFCIDLLALRASTKVLVLVQYSWNFVQVNLPKVRRILLVGCSMLMLALQILAWTPQRTEISSYSALRRICCLNSDVDYRHFLGRLPLLLTIKSRVQSRVRVRIKVRIGKILSLVHCAEQYDEVIPTGLSSWYVRSRSRLSVPWSRELRTFG